MIFSIKSARSTRKDTLAEPDRTLRTLIGEGTKLEDVFTTERIAAGQKTLDNARSAFFDRAREELGKLEDLAAKNAAAPEHNETTFEDMAEYAGNLRGHAEMFGFGLVAGICGHIGILCEPDGPYSAAARINLTGDLVRMLGIAVREKVTDETGAAGRELRASLGKY